MCEEALSKTADEHTGQKIKGVRATDDSSAWEGFINSSGEEGGLNRIFQMSLLTTGALQALESLRTWISKICGLLPHPTPWSTDRSSPACVAIHSLSLYLSN